MKSVLLLQFVSVCVSVIVIYYGVVLLLLPSIIHRLWVYIQSLTTASGSLLFGSMVRALNFYPGRPDSNNTIGVTFFFIYVSFLCYEFHVVRLGLVRDRTLLRRKWLRVIINDDFLEKGECYGLALLPSIICLGRLRIACRYIFTL